MKATLRWTTCLSLALGSAAFAQQTTSRIPKAPFPCSGQHSLSVECKPVLSGALSAPPSGLPRHDDGATYITFDPPGSVDTEVAGLDVWGNVAGWYEDANFIAHGFLRQTNGTMISFDDPQAVYGTFVNAINDIGVVTGSYWDINQQFAGAHGFLRTPNGAYVTFDAPDDVNGMGPASINLFGAITGSYFDENFVTHGFVRDPFGNLTTFDVPGSQSTNPTSINLEGTVVGQYFDSTGSHGFQRTWDGRITTFDVPGGNNTAYYPYGGGAIASINLLGTIATNYFQPITGNPFGGNHRGAIRTRQGTYQTFDASTSGPCCTWTYPIAITPEGTTTGYDNDGFSIFHGFVRTSDGNITLFDVPGAGTANYEGTVPLAINPLRVITGVMRDSNRVDHGFVRIPH